MSDLAFRASSTEPRATTAPPGRTKGGVGDRTYGALRSVPTTVLWILVAIWSLPTLGMFVSSFRNETAVKTTGWWTVVSNPQLTLDNYRQVFSSQGTDSVE